MDISSIITQVNDPDIVAIDIDTIEIKTDGSVHKNNDANIILHQGVCLKGDSTDADGAARDLTKPQPPPASSSTAPALVPAADCKPPRGRLFRDLICCCPCLGGDGRGAASERRRRRRQQRQQQRQQQQQQHRQNGQACAVDLLRPRDPALGDRICAVIDLDETLVHSSFKFVEEPDFTIDVEIEGLVHPVYVLKRPHVDQFLERVGQLFECVLFTASLAKYADPVSDRLDKWSAFKHRLFREACVFHGDNFVKDLSQLGRQVDRCVIIDNSPASYMFHTENAIRVRTWVGDPADTELRDLLPYLEQLAASPSVSQFLRDCPPPQQPPGLLQAADDSAQLPTPPPTPPPLPPAQAVIDGDCAEVDAIQLGEIQPAGLAES